VLAAVRAQTIDAQLLVCDSGSTDGSAAIAFDKGASVIEIPPASFAHGATRNLLLQRASTSHVALLTQDAVPADPRWLAKLMSAFELADDVAIAFGPYLPRPGASAMVRRELRDWFAQLQREPITRLATAQRDLPPRELLGARGYFTSANCVIARGAWERVPFPDVAYAEDHALAHAMLRAGYAKAYVPEAGVVHSHDYSPGEWLRRSFDEARAVHDVYGFAPELSLRHPALDIWGAVGADYRFDRRAGTLPRATLHHGARRLGAVLGARSERLPGWAVRLLSLERRGG
jgi:rhamnosyltransferase